MGPVGSVTELEQARAAYADRSWTSTYERFKRADDAVPLAAHDLELLATSAYMLGRNDEYFEALERAHTEHLNAGDALPAARCAFWVGIQLAQQGEMGRASGWLARSARLVEREGRDCVEQGYLLLPLMFQQEGAGDLEAAIATAARAIETGERFGDRDLMALAMHSQGHLLALDGRPREGLPLLDESMVAVAAGELSPIVSGIVYCGVILGCQAAYEPRRAQEWTAALAQWWQQQPDMVAFTGRCLVHRAEVLERQGAWADALEEAQRAGPRCLAGKNPKAAGEAAYLKAEVHRLQGRSEAAEEAYREANELGREPQPGLALLRLEHGETDAALAAIRRALGEAMERPKRIGLLPAYVELVLAAGDLRAAQEACRELEELAVGYEGGMLDAVAAHARGTVELAAGNAGSALRSLRTALHAWQGLDAPYEAARSRVRIAKACRALGDSDAAAMEAEAARATFERLGAAPELARLETLSELVEGRGTHGLTGRELEVLRLVAAGKTNRAIAAELVISERTVDRHVSNIFVKLGVASRSAATAFAYEHGLV